MESVSCPESIKVEAHGYLKFAWGSAFLIRYWLGEAEILEVYYTDEFRAYRDEIRDHRRGRSLCFKRPPVGRHSKPFLVLG
jgi:hypothetical protein